MQMQQRKTRTRPRGCDHNEYQINKPVESETPVDQHEIEKPVNYYEINKAVKFSSRSRAKWLNNGRRNHRARVVANYPFPTS